MSRLDIHQLGHDFFAVQTDLLSQHHYVAIAPKMKALKSFAKVLVLSSYPASCHRLSRCVQAPSVTDAPTKVTFRGNLSNVESFLNIRFGQDTSGAHRFPHPQASEYPSGTEVDTSTPGAACPRPQDPVQGFVFANITDMQRIA